jgi:hypothetical protein
MRFEFSGETGAQESYLQTLAEEAHENVEPDLTKAEASKERLIV